MTPEERATFRNQGVIPDGWRRCPDCNGEGVISTMEATPHLDERRTDCTRCEADLGIVPVEAA